MARASIPVIAYERTGYTVHYPNMSECCRAYDLPNRDRLVDLILSGDTYNGITFDWAMYAEQKEIDHVVKGYKNRKRGKWV